jgi:hypothetical protein
LEFTIIIKLGYQNILICLVHMKTYEYVQVVENDNTNIRTNARINPPSSNTQEKYMIEKDCI